MNRKYTDIFFKYLFRIVSLVSVLALGAILFFVFIEGIIPFIQSTAGGIRLVAENIDELTVNGETYYDHVGFINLPKDVGSISIRIPKGSGAGFTGGFNFLFDEDWDWDWDDDDEEDDEDLAYDEIEYEIEDDNEDSSEDDITGEEELEIVINSGERAAEKIISFVTNSSGEISYPEAYVCTISWPGMIAAMDKKIHIILPEPPYNPVKFFAGLEWRPIRDKLFGIFPMITATILGSLGAILLGVPIGLLCAVFLAEFLPGKIAAIARSGIELLAGIPSVVYGFFGLMVIVPAVKRIFNIPAGNTLFSAIIVLALMILPTVITIAETSMRAVPLSLREASLSLGASKMQTAWRVTLPHAQSGVIAGVILGISRAVGETMAVILVAGNSPQLTLNPLQSVRTLTSTIAMEMGYASGRHSEMLFSIGVVLFIIILFLNSMILAFRRRALTAQGLEKELG
ncbi:MAG: phosphate ABC transporter permease subunit PstC [Treponema sp.]|nr:phosphate ABC transporter permease subunit PstC [Treponema sp.]